MSFDFGKYLGPRTRFKTLDEFYEAVTALSAWLKREGHLEDARKLDTLMHMPWTAGSELLGELMLALEGMKGRYNAELQAEINECKEFAKHHRKILGLG